MRPTLHRNSKAGVLPFMPSVSTVGAFANDLIKTKFYFLQLKSCFRIASSKQAFIRQFVVAKRVICMSHAMIEHQR